MLKSCHFSAICTEISMCNNENMRGCPQSTFRIHPTASEPFIALSDCMYVHNRVIDDACASETSIVLTAASLQYFKMEALIPAPADCEVRL